MAGVNKVILVGHLGKDPEMRYAASGLAIANFSLATSENRKDKEGNKETKTEWHRIVAFGKLAEICGEYLNKGKQIYIEGRIQTNKWEDKEGNTRYTTEIIASTMQMLGSKGDNAGGGSYGGGGGGESSGGSSSGGGGEQPPPPDLDDIPF